MFEGQIKKLGRRPWLWLVLTTVALISLGLLLPNRDLILVRLFWLWSVTLPLWLVISFGLALGAISAGSGLTLLWLVEHRRRKDAEQQREAVLDEVRALRRLLAQDAGQDLAVSTSQSDKP